VSRCNEIGLECPRSARYVSSVDEALAAADELGYPLVLRPSFTLGGRVAGSPTTRPELRERIARGIADSPVGEVLVEESVLGWKEFELEVMRDRNDNCVIVCSIENVDAMGVHTGDSITVAPAMTLSDPELQSMRDAAFASCAHRRGDRGIERPVRRRSGTGTSARHRDEPARVALSALASKATGFPIAKIAARLAARLHAGRDRERHHGSRRGRVRAVHRLRRHEGPTLRLREVPGADDTLTTRMHSVGEVMAFGRILPREPSPKALRALEDGKSVGREPRTTSSNVDPRGGPPPETPR
jgi:carbamoyl-phosphate synthase large subunit